MPMYPLKLQLLPAYYSSCDIEKSLVVVIQFWHTYCILMSQKSFSRVAYLYQNDHYCLCSYCLFVLLHPLTREINQ